MKNYTICALVVLILVSANLGMSRQWRHALIEVEPRVSFYILEEDNVFGIGGDVILNPLRNLGLRINMAELTFDGGTFFTLNSAFRSAMPKVEALIYIPARGIQPYIHTGFGLRTGEGATFLSIGGGVGFDFLTQGPLLSAEPGIYILHESFDDFDNTEVVFRISFGAKLNIFQ